MSLEDFIIHAYCQICAAYAAVVHSPLRRRGFALLSSVMKRC